MLAYAFYKVTHLIGVFLVLTGLAGALIPQIGAALSAGSRRVAAICHGVGMVLALVGGFGMMARLRIHWPWPPWLWGKVLIWGLLGALLGVALRRSALARRLWWLPVALGAVAVYLAIYQPG